MSRGAVTDKPMMWDRLRRALRHVIVAAIALVLVVMPAVHPATSAYAIEKPRSAHSHSLNEHDHAVVSDGQQSAADCDKTEQANKAIPHELPDEDCDGACCEGSCVPLVAFSTDVFDVAMPLRDAHRIILSDAANGHLVFDFLRPPRT